MIIIIISIEENEGGGLSVYGRASSNNKTEREVELSNAIAHELERLKIENAQKYGEDETSVLKFNK